LKFEIHYTTNYEQLTNIEVKVEVEDPALDGIRHLFC